MTKPAWIASGCFAALALAWAGVQLTLWAPVNIARGSMLYTLKVPSAAKQFAVWDAADTPSYDIVRGTGDAPNYTLIRYRSRLDVTALERRATAAGFRCQKLGEQIRTCDRSRGGALEAQVTVRGEARSSEVTVMIPDA